MSSISSKSTGNHPPIIVTSINCVKSKEKGYLILISKIFLRISMSRSRITKMRILEPLKSLKIMM